MTPDKLPCPRQETVTVEVEADESHDLAAHREVMLRYANDSEEILFRYAEEWFSCKPGSDSRKVLLDVLQAAMPHLAIVTKVVALDLGKQSVTLHLSIYPNALEWSRQEFDIGVDEKISEKVRSKHLLDNSSASGESVMAWLAENLLCPSPQSTDVFRAAISFGRTKSQRDAQVASFTIWGDRIVADVALRPNGRLRIENLVKGRQKDERGLSLLQAPISFHDASQAAVFRDEARNELGRITAQADSYLELWRQYNDLERKIILRRAREIGIFRFSRFDSRGEKLEVTIIHDDNAREFFGKLDANDSDEFDASVEYPQFIEQPEFGESLQQQLRALNRVNVGRLVEIDLVNYRLLFECDDPDQVMNSIPDKGYLFASLGGDSKRLQRRDDAEARIRNAVSPMPQLGLLLENMPVQRSRYKKHKPISAQSRKLFSGEPTRRQIEALDVALNTPDIALIQGPPGTGKTQVIAALQAQLAKIDENEGPQTGQILLTSYQHDAVVQAASRTEVFGLPAINLSRRKGREVGDGFEAWRIETAQVVRAKLEQLDGSQYSLLMQLRQRVWAHMQQMAKPEDSAVLLSDVERDFGDRLSAQLRSSINSRIGELRRIDINVNDDGENDLALKAVRGLRTMSVAFSDDGPVQAYKALSRLKRSGMLTEDENNLLTQASEWESEAPPPFLENLDRLKINLLNRLASSRASKRPDFNDEVTRTLLAESVGELDKVLRGSRSGAAAAINDYLSSIENDPDGIRRALAEYTVVLATTCQQADSDAIRDAKNDSPVFESVIIDEAARANPLDLLIPMAMARRRIVLVGDHRQLPQILDEEVQRVIQTDRDNQDFGSLKESLFERLFRNLKEREMQDGVKRTVTLDTQYRMHPTLGAFVSRYFYETFGDPEIKPGKDASQFSHALPVYADRVAAWISVPCERGREKRVGRSFSRETEAVAVAKELVRLIEASPDMSIGIVSFYSAQIAEIWRQLEKIGIAVRDENGFRIIQKYRYATDQSGRQTDRVQIGTVDSFQGKEFDVVILSLTRSNDFRATADEDKLHRKYGFLTLINRLCVAMSRQRRLLIVVGDEKMVESIPDGVTSLDPLRGFLALCRNENERL
jgi:hypothetical protein